MSEIPIIRIPIANSDSRIGEVLISLFSVIEETESHGQRVIWDYSDIDYLHPFFISALAVYRDSLRDEIREINIGSLLNARFKEIMFAEPLEFMDENSPDNILKSFKESGRSPICKFSRKYKWIDELQAELFSITAAEIRHRVEGWTPHTPISYLISELTCNIQEHSDASCGYMLMQCPIDDDSLYICIADNGITIHGSYVKSRKFELARIIGLDHAEALRYSTKGISTKNRPDNESRGYGISTNLDMVVNGLGGSFFLLSGRAFFRSDEEGEQFVNLPEGMNWDGTIILVRIPLKQNDSFNVYKYIE